MSYQFIHIDSYAREGSKQTKTVIKKNGDKITTTTQSRNLREILAEQAREPGNCPHIAQPEPPTVIYGLPPGEVLEVAEKWAEQATDALGRKLRKDGLCAIVGVASLPRELEQNFSDFTRDTVAWLQDRYGDRLRSVIAHNDEAHPHLHFTVVPKDGERFDDIHDGYKASRQAKQAGQKKGEQNLAYISAMRTMQDEFSSHVAMRHGLTRIGPGKRRLTRAQWHAEKAQARFFADAKAQHRGARKKGYKDGLAKAQAEGQEIVESATRQARAVGARLGGWVAGALGEWHKPTGAALEAKAEEAERARRRQKRAEEEARKFKEQADKRVSTIATQLQTVKQQHDYAERENKQLRQEIEQLRTENERLSPAKSTAFNPAKKPQK